GFYFFIVSFGRWGADIEHQSGIVNRGRRQCRARREYCQRHCLVAFQFDLSFAPGPVSAASIGEGAFLAGGGTTAFIPGTIDNVGGTIAATADTLIGPGPGVNGRGARAVLTLTGLAPGASSIDFSSVFLLDSNLTGINSSLQSGSVAVTPRTAPTPEPSSLVLWISGMSVLAFMLLRRR